MEKLLLFELEEEEELLELELVVLLELEVVQVELGHSLRGALSCSPTESSLFGVKAKVRAIDLRT